jgi:Innexin
MCYAVQHYERNHLPDNECLVHNIGSFIHHSRSLPSVSVEMGQCQSMASSNACSKDFFLGVEEGHFSSVVSALATLQNATEEEVNRYVSILFLVLKINATDDHFFSCSFSVNLQPAHSWPAPEHREPPVFRLHHQATVILLHIFCAVATGIHFLSPVECIASGYTDSRLYINSYCWNIWQKDLSEIPYADVRQFHVMFFIQPLIFLPA